MRVRTLCILLWSLAPQIYGNRCGPEGNAIDRESAPRGRTRYRDCLKSPMHDRSASRNSKTMAKQDKQRGPARPPHHPSSIGEPLTVDIIYHGTRSGGSWVGGSRPMPGPAVECANA